MLQEVLIFDLTRTDMKSRCIRSPFCLNATDKPHLRTHFQVQLAAVMTNNTNKYEIIRFQTTSSLFPILGFLLLTVNKVQGDSKLLSGFPWPIIFKPEIIK
jgi:hypothetical protein